MKNYAILDISQFESATDKAEFYANTLENHLRSGHKNIHRPHKHNFYLAVLFTQGIGTHEIDFTTYEVKPGSLFFLNPGQMHHWEFSEDTAGFIFFHTQGFYDLHFTHNRVNNFPFFYSAHASPNLYANPAEAATIREYFELIYAESHRTDILKSQKIISLIDLVYIESTRLFIQENNSEVMVQNSYSAKFREFEQLVEMHFKTEKSAARYADWLHISAKHLNRITQNMVGKTTTEMLLERIILEAKREMIAGKFSFSQIAIDLGYEDYAYFSRLFKKKCGETPSTFINKYR